jgi:hypothetical protein
MKFTEIQQNINEIFEVLNHCAEKKYRLCTLILIYSGIDLVASLGRPKDHLDTGGDIFKDWVQKYLLPHLPPGLSPADLWGARCGVLHTNQPDSKVSRAGTARALHYVQGEPDFIKYIQNKIDPDKKKAVFLDMRSLCEGFMQAVIDFLRDVSRDEELRARVSHHAEKVFVKYEHNIPEIPSHQS